jgi:hypothetical protein
MIQSTSSFAFLLRIASFVLNVSPRISSRSPIDLAPDASPLREFSHRTVNGQRGFRIWFFRLPFDGLNHS